MRSTSFILDVSSLIFLVLQSAGQVHSCRLRVSSKMSRVNNPPSPTSIYSRNQDLNYESHDHFQPPQYHSDPPSFKFTEHSQHGDQEWLDHGYRRGLTSRFSTHDQPSGTNMRNDRLAMRRDSEEGWNSRAAPIEKGLIRRVQLSRQGHFIQVGDGCALFVRARINIRREVLMLLLTFSTELRSPTAYFLFSRASGIG